MSINDFAEWANKIRTENKSEWENYCKQENRRLDQVKCCNKCAWLYSLNSSEYSCSELPTQSINTIVTLDNNKLNEFYCSEFKWRDNV